MGRRHSRTSVPAGHQTMELDAVVDQLEEINAPSGGFGAPPPLPPKKSNPLMYVVAVVVVLMMGGLGIAAGSLLLGEPEPTVPTAAPEEPAPEEPAQPEPEPTEAAPDVVQLEEVVFDDE